MRYIIILIKWINLGMVTTQDEQRGLVKVYWQDIEKRIAQIEPNSLES